MNRLAIHLLGIAACSICAFVLLIVAFGFGWDYGDHVTGDVVLPGAQFSVIERACFHVSRFVTSPVRWIPASHSTLRIPAFVLLQIAWGTLIYLAGYAAFRALRSRFLLPATPI